jgi:hypothetical protein
MTSYILGDLDISGESEEEESEFASSFEISSNSSARLSSKVVPGKKFCEDDQQGYLKDEAFQGFISKQSPFSFKNPIFFSCPNNK